MTKRVYGVENIARKRMKDVDWVAPTSLRNYFLNDKILDWLKLYYTDLDIPLEIKNSVQSFDENNITKFLFDQGKSFENFVIKKIYEKYRNFIVDINSSPFNRERKFKETLNAMNNGTPIIYNGTIVDYDRKIYGFPDLLIRSDWLNRLIEYPVFEDSETKIPSIFSESYHYRVIDIKFTTLHFLKNGINIGNSDSTRPFKSQVVFYADILNNIQKSDIKNTYIAGRKCDYEDIKCSGLSDLKNKIFSRLGVVDSENFDKDFVEENIKAVEWIRKVRNEGRGWNVFDTTNENLSPNMCNSKDSPFSILKQYIAEKRQELTLLWNVGPKNREYAKEKFGITSYTHRDCNANTLNICDSNKSIFDTILSFNKKFLVDTTLTNRCYSNADKSELMYPSQIKNHLDILNSSDTEEFFVDFETINDIFFDMNENITFDGNKIFMIGIGYTEKDEENKTVWKYKNLSAKSLCEDEYSRIFNEFNNFVNTKSYPKTPKLFHWSPFEKTEYEKKSNNNLNWTDLCKIFKKTPIVIYGCLNFSLKNIVAKMKEHNLINSDWKDTDIYSGDNAMLVSYKSYIRCKDQNIDDISKDPKFQEIIHYNEMDCKVLYEILSFLREHYVAKLL